MTHLPNPKQQIPHLSLSEESEFYDSTRAQIVIDRSDSANVGVVETIELELIRRELEARRVIVFIGYYKVNDSSGS